MDLTVTCIQIGLMQLLGFAQSLTQRFDEVFRQDRHAVFVAFSLADDDFTQFEVDILDAQP